MLREGLPLLPQRMTHLSLDHRGYPVPWFVKWFHGKPDFRVADAAKWRLAVRFGYCWLCGDRLGVHKTFVIGPMCAVNRITSEPPCHTECAHFAVEACPFLLLPRAGRRENNLPEGGYVPGNGLKRNPGVVCLWQSKKFKLVKLTDGKQLIGVGDPVQIDWFAEGLRATRMQVEESLESGLPELYRLARMDADRIGTLVQLENQWARAQAYLPEN